MGEGHGGKTWRKDKRCNQRVSSRSREIHRRWKRISLGNRNSVMETGVSVMETGVGQSRSVSQRIGCKWPFGLFLISSSSF